MSILVINAGSSSIKYALFHSTSLKLVTKGKIEEIKDFKEAFIKLEWVLWDLNIDLRTIDAIAHRVVHGGEKFIKPTLITPNVIDELKKLIPLAPLHNPANINGIEVCLNFAKGVKNYAIFDTSFHQSMPPHSYLYAIDTKYHKEHSIRRYGFHGISHHYVAKEAANILGKKLEELNLITFHIGNGASVTAIKKGKSYDTSMGMTPLEGLMMGSRCGDLDPMIVGYMAKELNLSIDEVENILNKKSGLLAIAKSSDMREILSSSSKEATLAVDIYVHRLKKYLGAYSAMLNPLDAIVFTGGIGENSHAIRSKLLSDLNHIGIEFDETKTSSNMIHKDSSRVKLLVIKTDEEYQIAQYVKELLPRL